MFKNNYGYVALGIAVFIGAAITAAVIFLGTQGGMKSRQLDGDIQINEGDGVLKQYVTQTSALFRQELFKGVNPENPLKKSDDFEASDLDFKCMANPDYTNPAHLFVEKNPPNGLNIVYTCKIISKPALQVILTAYFQKNATVLETPNVVAHISYQLPIGKVVSYKGSDIQRTNKLVPEIDSASPLDLSTPIKSTIFLHDYIKTKNKQFIKIFLNDKTVIQLGPNSEFYFKKFHYKKINDRMTLYKLLKGSLQILYGAKNSNEELLIETPSVSLGVRGTEYTLNVNDLPSAYYVTMDVISGEVDVFDKNNIFIKTVKEGETFNHYQSKINDQGFNIYGTRRDFENNFYQPVTIPTNPASVPSSVTDIISEKFDTRAVLMDIRKDNLLLYGYFHNALRDPNKHYFDHITSSGGGSWSGYYRQIRSTLDHEPLYISTHTKFTGMEFLMNQTPVPNNFEIALMSPSNFETTFNPNLDFALVYNKNDLNYGYLLIYPKEDLGTLTQRFTPGLYSKISNDLVFMPLNNLKLKEGKIVGCAGGACGSLAELRAEIPTGYNAGYLISFVGGNKHLTRYPLPPPPVASGGNTPGGGNSSNNNPVSVQNTCTVVAGGTGCTTSGTNTSMQTPAPGAEGQQ